MPNWCGNTNIYWTEKEHKEELQNFFDFIQKQDNLKKEKEDFNLTWLCDLLEANGMNSNRYECRGYITELSPNIKEKENLVYFRIETDTAWKPMPNAMKALTKNYPHLHLAYSSEESGTGIFVTNDRKGKFFKDTWRLETDIYGNKETQKKIKKKYPLLLQNSTNYYEEEEGIEYLKELFDLPNISSEKLKETYEKEIEKFAQKILKEFPDLELLDLTFQHISYE